MATRAKVWAPYALAVGLTGPVLVAVALVYLKYQRPIVLGFVPPVVISAYISGLRGGLTATAIAVLGSIVVLMVGAPSGIDGVDAIRVIMVGMLGLVFSILSERLRRARERASAALGESRQAENRFRQLFDASTISSSVTRVSDGTVVEVNEAYLALFGVTRAQIVGSTATAAGIQWVDPAQRAALTSLVGVGQEVRDVEVAFKQPGGEVRTGQLSSRVFEQAGELLMLCTTVDVTARRALEDRLREAQRLESIGLFAGGIAHDFNNILGVIKTNAEMLADSVDRTHPEWELVDDISAGVTRASALTRQLLAFSRKQIVEPVVLDVNATIRDTCKLLTQLVGEDVAIRVAFDKEAPRVLFDPGQFTQLLMNLAVNARDAMKRSGTLWIETRTANRDVEILVRDTGCGMTDEVRARIFEPFFTTKGVGEGTGLGLSVVHGIVEDAGGKVSVDTTVDAGTTFRITLPAATREHSLPVELVMKSRLRGDETILLVDDDPHIRASTARALRARGYTVHEASEGRMALALLEDHQVQLMVTDVVMPHMNGRVLADAAKLRLPFLPVLFMSGYTDDEILRAGVLQTEVPFLEKPFRLEALANKVRQLLDGPSQVH